jgi:hypothetical protein
MKATLKPGLTHRFAYKAPRAKVRVAEKTKAAGLANG